MNFTFENQGTNTYLVYEIGSTDEVDTMSLGMLTNNAIPGLASASFMQMDNTRYIKYNVSAKVSVAQLFNGPVNKKRLIGVLSGIVEAMLSAEDYMLNPDGLLLDLDYIFSDVSTCKTEVVCIPVIDPERKNPELGKFFKGIVYNVQFDQTENCDYVTTILNYLNGAPILSLSGFKETLDEIARSADVNAPEKRVTPVEPRVIPVPEIPKEQSKPAASQTTPAFSMPAPQTVRKQEVTPHMTIPTPPGNDENASSAAVAPGEKPMTLFYLLQHYSKENAAIYKAQQDAKKSQSAKDKSLAPSKSASKQSKAGFAIPGQKAEVGRMAIPGKPAEVKPGFVVPGQQPAVSAQPAVSHAEIQQPQQKKAESYYQPSVPQGAPISFGETTVLGAAGGGTTALVDSAVSQKVDPYLVRRKTGEKIILSKTVFKIGKERSYVDYCISDNPAISRSHATIINRGGNFVVIDTNSTNHTYVNGVMISSNAETPLSHGTVIRMANEEFEFNLN